MSRDETERTLQPVGERGRRGACAGPPNSRLTVAAVAVLAVTCQVAIVKVFPYLLPVEPSEGPPLEGRGGARSAAGRRG